MKINILPSNHLKEIYLPSHNELLEKKLKTIIMSITIAINNMFQQFKRNISFILYNNSAELNILFKMKKSKNRRVIFFFSFFFYLASKQNNEQI